MYKISSNVSEEYLMYLRDIDDLSGFRRLGGNSIIYRRSPVRILGHLSPLSTMAQWAHSPGSHGSGWGSGVVAGCGDDDPPPPNCEDTLDTDDCDECITDNCDNSNNCDNSGDCNNSSNCGEDCVDTSNSSNSDGCRDNSYNCDDDCFDIPAESW